MRRTGRAVAGEEEGRHRSVSGEWEESVGSEAQEAVAGEPQEGVGPVEEE